MMASPVRTALVMLAALACGVVGQLAAPVPAHGGARAWAAASPVRGRGESQIDESAPDESSAGRGQPAAPASLPERLREYVEGSLARYDDLKHSTAGFRRQGWFPSLFLREPARDVVVERGAGGTVVTVNLFYARRDIEQRLVVAPAERFELPGADKRFFCELLGALAAASPEVARARLRFWFAALGANGQMTWESRGGVGLTAAAARRFPAGARTAEALWPLLDENSLPPAVWEDR